MLTFKGRVAVISGAAHGIGLALAEALAEEGTELLPTDIDAGALHDAAARLQASGAKIEARPADVSSADDWSALAAFAAERFSRVDLLCSNAGVTAGGRDIDSVETRDWDWILAVNLYGSIHGVRAFLPMLRQRDEAHILFTGSMGGFYGAAGNAPYCASKAALLSYAESLSRELRRNGEAIGVSYLCPSAVNTTLAISESRRPERFFGTNPSVFGDAASAELTAARAATIEPSIVAAMALAAIRAQRFYVPTHTNAQGVMRRRAEDAEAGRQPN